MGFNTLSELVYGNIVRLRHQLKTKKISRPMYVFDHFCFVFVGELYFPHHCPSSVTVMGNTLISVNSENNVPVSI